MVKKRGASRATVRAARARGACAAQPARARRVCGAAGASDVAAWCGFVSVQQDFRRGAIRPDLTLSSLSCGVCLQTAESTNVGCGRLHHIDHSRLHGPLSQCGYFTWPGCTLHVPSGFPSLRANREPLFVCFLYPVVRRKVWKLYFKPRDIEKELIRNHSEISPTTSSATDEKTTRAD